MFRTTWDAGNGTAKWKGRARLWHVAASRACVTGLVMGSIAALQLHPQRRIPIDELSPVSQATFTYIDQLTHKMSNSPAQKRSRHQVFLPDALPPPSSPTRPGSPILIGSHPEVSLMAENDAPIWTSGELISRCTSCPTSRNSH